MVVFDSSVLIDLFNDKLAGDKRAKLDDLIQSLGKQRTKILIPTPVLTEWMAKAGTARDGYFQRINAQSMFRIAPFATKAAMECALLLDSAKTTGDKRQGAKTWAKAKFDWQIACIAKAEGATTIYSDDDDVARVGKRLNVKVVKIDDLPLPEAAKQGILDLSPLQ
ncbi:type II toxin-antitoxin system VapC family toxin [Chitinimonas sp.]|uniref:type II toxin-antitoxin system VapC family toxin n=1 Tax=Chitinimonas sp. TaxID=1934313 RepID=UPI002F936EE4